MMKKYYLTLIALLLPLLASAEYDVKVNKVFYKLNTSEKTAIVTYDKRGGYTGDVIILPELDVSGEIYSVTSIGSAAFDGCSDLTSVTIPGSVTSIGTTAFSGCYKLTSIEIPDGVNTIGSSVFSNCKGLVSVTIPSSVASIGDYAFSGCTALQSLIIPSKVHTIGSGAFRLCSALTSLVIPNKVTSIGKEAFFGCSGLTYVTIGSGVNTIGNDAFWACSRLFSIVFLGSTPPEFGGSAVFDLVDKQGCAVWVPFGCLTGYSNNAVVSEFATIREIPQDGVHIGGFNYFILNQWGAKRAIVLSGPVSGDVVIPSEVPFEGEFFSVTSIGTKAFNGCTGLTSVSIPNSVTLIAVSAFEGCTGLAAVSFSSRVTDIQEKAFAGCTGLTFVYLPNNLSFIGKSAFAGCTSLDYIMPSNNLAYIGTGAFYDTAWYDNQPDGLVYLGNVAYAYKGEMPRGTTITLRAGTLGIAGGAFADCKRLEEINIPEGATVIGDEAFKGDTGLRAVNIPNSVYNIGTQAFEGCSSLLYINIPNNVYNILYRTFSDTNLHTVTIGKGVSEIYEEAFSGSSQLSDIVSLKSTPPRCTNSAVFTNVDIENCTVWVPKGSVEAYSNDEVWGLFPQIREIVEGDLNLNGFVDKWDLDYLVRYVLGDIFWGFPSPRYDIDGDGKVDAADVVKLISLMK